MMRPALDVDDVILFHLPLKATAPAPTGVLAPVIGQHFLGRLILARRYPVNFDHRLRRRTAEEIRPHHETRIIVQKSNQVSVTTPQAKGEDVALPHLVRRGPLKETRPDQVAS